MSVSGSDFFGWDLLYRTIENQIVRESDVLIALIHWYLIKKLSFHCVGIGEDKTLNPEDQGTELLPQGWNLTPERYALRYSHNQELFIVLGVHSEGTLILNMLNVANKNVSNIALTPKDEVKSLKGTLQQMIPKASQLVERLKNELTTPVFAGRCREVTTQTQSLPRDRNLNAHAQPFRPFSVGEQDRYNYYPNPHPSPSVGVGDLDPLGGGNGGMIYNPPTLPPFGLPPSQPQPPAPFGIPPPPPFLNPNRSNPNFGHHPPGARFDPFGPPDRGHTANPNPDHIRPPNEFDDMYM